MRHSRNGQSRRTLKTSASRNSSERLAAAGKPKVIDLFAGVGGFSLGAARAGFEVAVAIDLDRHAVAAHKKNFPHTQHPRRNIVNLSGADVLRLAKLKKEKLVGIIGGPPCQGFSTMGRRRKNDSRNSLFFHFFRLVSETRPLFFVAENVPGILAPKYEAIRRSALKLVDHYYNVAGPFTLCPSNFGAATVRPRVFFVGIAKRSRAKLSPEDFTPCATRRKTLVKTALAGLMPNIKATWQNEESSWRQIKQSNSKFFFAINRFCESTGDPSAVQRFVDKLEASGFLGTQHTVDVVERFAAVDPGKTDKVSKFPRLSWDGLCPTLRAGTDHRRGSYQAVRPIHPKKNRVITPREAARLQGFPDWFQFSPTKWHSFRQIGNSVSPLLAEKLLDTIRKKLSDIGDQEETSASAKVGKYL
ncbi:MAG TPA: DNA cytosine methyltransferase [Chthoniobacterales bacterium]|nr:DNA cytosine methyltransferase [Chthoniobacterales bacterium]